MFELDKIYIYICTYIDFSINSLKSNRKFDSYRSMKQLVSVSAAYKLII